MNDFFHGILLDQQFKQPNFIDNNFKVFAKRKSSTNPWNIYGVEISNSQLEETINIIQQGMKSNKPYYAHLYDDDQLIVIYKTKVFYITPHISTWKEAVDYGKALGIPAEQLSFWPNRFQDEARDFR